MSRSHVFIGLVLSVAAIAAVPQPNGAISKALGDVSCEIRAMPFTGGVHLQGVAKSKAPVSGSYELTVTKSGASGSSSNVQSGDFSAGPGEDGALGEVSLGLDGGASYAAVLRLQWSGGTAKCEKHSS